MIGTSVEGRPIELVSVGNGAARVLVIGGIHGDEMGAHVARAFLRFVLEHPRSVPAGTRLDIVPVANPDGEVAGTRGNARGVDLNRNFPAQNWMSALSRGDGPATGLTGGRAAASEPETVALLARLDDGYRLVISLHSEGGLIDYDGEGGRAVARRMSALSGLPVKHVAYQQHVTGSLGVFVSEHHGIPVITVELESRELTSGVRESLLQALGR